MIKRLLYILSIYFTNGYFWIFMGFISMILLSIVMMSSLQASEICNFAKQIEPTDNDLIQKFNKFSLINKSMIIAKVLQI